MQHDGLDAGLSQALGKVVERVPVEGEQHHLLADVLSPVALEVLHQDGELAVVSSQPLIVATLPGDATQDGQELTGAVLGDRDMCGVLLDRVTGELGHGLLCHLSLFFLPALPAHARGRHATRHLPLRNGQQEALGDVGRLTVLLHRLGHALIEVALGWAHFDTQCAWLPGDPQLVHLALEGARDDLCPGVQAVKQLSVVGSRPHIAQVLVRWQILEQVLNLLAVLEPPQRDGLLQRGLEFILRHRRVALQPVPQCHDGGVGSDRMVIGPLHRKCVLVQEVQQVEQVRAAHLDGRCRQQGQAIGHRPQ